ncbi:MAG: translocation/assembly module TamB domain-containing protein, partial [Bacteroidota bacterium]
MSDTANTNADSSTPKPRRPFAVKLLRLLAFTGLALVVLLAALIGFSETETFRSLLRDVIVDAADSSLNAHLTIETIEGNLFAGWKLGGVKLQDANGTIAEIESVVLRYNLFRAPWKRITIDELTLNAPRISITKGAGRDWNISTLVRPTEEDTTTTPFDWVIVVENVRIIDGTLLVYDSTQTGPFRRDRLDSKHMLLEKLNLALSATIAPERKMLSLNQGSWSNTFGDVSMLNLSGDILLRDDMVSVKGLSVQTERSAFIISTSVKGADLFGELNKEVLRSLRMELTLDAPKVDERDLQYFLPSLDFLGSSGSLEIEASGTLDELHIKHLQIEELESVIVLRGTLRNILDGAKMRIDAESDNTVIKGTDVPAILPGFPLMDVSGLGTARFRKLAFHGQPLLFDAEIDMESDAGGLAGTIRLDVTGDELVYEGKLLTRGIDMSKVLKNPKLRSDLNLEATLKGRGTRLGSMNTVLNLRADSTRFQRYVTNTLTLSVEVRSDSLNFNIHSSLGPSALNAEGGMTLRGDSIAGFRLIADAQKLDLAKVLDDDGLSSDLTFALKAHGDGIDLSTLSGEVGIIFAPSRLKDIRIDPDTFRLMIQQTAGQPEQLLLESQYADARLVGQFDLPRFGNYMSRQFDSLNAAIATYALRPDSVRTAEAQRQTERAAARAAARAARRSAASGEASPSSSDSASAARRRGRGIDAGFAVDTTDFMDVKYSLTLKKPDRIARYFDASTFLVRGTWDGRIAGGLNGFDIGGEIAFSDFYYVDTLRTWLAAGVRCTYDVRNLKLEKPLDQLAMSLRFSATDMNLDGLRLSRTQVQLDWRESSPSLRFRSLIDTLAQIDLQAYAIYADNTLDIFAPRLQLTYRGDMWENQKEIAVRLDSSGIAVRQFDLAHDGMRLSLAGMRSTNGQNDFTVYADSIDIASLEFLLTGQIAARNGESFSGIGFVEANISGDDTSPLLAADVYIDSLGYRGSNFGEMSIEARYDNRKLELYSELTYEMPGGKDEKVFFVSGSIPIAISFGEKEKIKEESSANLRLQMREFPLALLEEFLGIFSPLSGTGNGDITVTGTAGDPSFKGYLTVSDGRGRFVYNNMEYSLGLRIEAEGRDINIVDLSVANMPSDWIDGRMTATGKIATEAFSIGEFDLNVKGRLKVLKFASRSAIRALYGDLYISTGSPELTYSGRLDRSKLLGEIIIEQGNLIFPLEESAGAVNKYADITYLTVDDTTKQRTSSLSAARFARLAGADPGDGDQVHVPERSVLAGLTYDLTLRTTGRLQLEIPFSMLQEELNAQLDVNNLKVNNWGGSGTKFVGEVTLGQDSYYIFFGKRMTASGVLRFTRDPQNPDLDLVAVYSDYYIDPRTQVRRRVYVTFRITGTKKIPELAYDLRWDEPNGESVTSAGEVQSDA